ncbi:BTB/POZ and MATH domain-containing protein 3-like [Triticum aestivum]|uniref:BTB/POZ and MATH domain-containing protein 3-like n=1 Tax=Triticum aestivum TaxID=4565 RepID=UPI001D01DBD4|nr:BTB/POZ and MATH domain-containing protein 3-like [Triticum aestivum]
MSFAGVSVVADRRLLNRPSMASVIYSGKASSGSWWYHLLVVQGYSCTKDLPNGGRIKGRSFRAGGYRWVLEFYPNGDVRDTAGFMSVYLVLDQHVARSVKVHCQFSFIDELDKQVNRCIRASRARDFCANNRAWGRSQFIKQEDLEKSVHLKDDCFTIWCDFIIAEAAATTFIEVPPSNVCEHLNHLFATKVGADVTFKVGHETFSAHRNILAARSAVFGPMKEGTTTGAIQIQDMEPNAFNALLGFIYTDLMPKVMKVGGEAEEVGADEVTWLRHLLAAADRFDLQRLKLMCEGRLSEHINLSSVTVILGLAAQHHCRGLKEACLEFLKVQSAAILGGAHRQACLKIIRSAGDDQGHAGDLHGNVAVKQDPEGLALFTPLENLISNTPTGIRKLTDDQTKKAWSLQSVSDSSSTMTHSEFNQV